MATKTAATQKPPTVSIPPSPGGRKIGRQADISFDKIGGAGSFTVNEQRGAEDVIQGSIQKTEQTGIERIRVQGNVAVDTHPPISFKQETGQTETFSSKDGTDTANAVDALLKIRGKQIERAGPAPGTPPQEPTAPPPVQDQQPAAPDASRAAFENKPQEALNSSQKPASQQASQGSLPKKPSNLLKGTGKILMYTSPGGFIIGKLAPRIKERFFAKKEVETVEKNAQANKIAASTERHTQKRKPSRTQKATRILRKLAFYSRPASLLFLAGKKLLPESIKARIPFFSLKKKTQEDTKPKHKKSLFERLSAWNTKTIKDAEARGYDRLAPVMKIREIRDMKIWKSRGWKVGEYVLGVLPAAGYDIHQRQMGRKNQEKRERLGGIFRSHWSNQKDTQPSTTSSGYFNWSPSRIKQSFFNKARSPFSSWNNRLGGNFGGRRVGGAARGIAKNAGKKATQKLAQKAATQAVATGAKAIILNPVVLAAIGIALVVIVFVVTILILILGSGGGDGSTNAGGGGTGGNPPIGGKPPSSNPIPDFKIGKIVDKETAAVDEPIIYTITYSYNPAAGATIKLSDITIYDKLPANTTFSAASGHGNYNSTTNTVSWSLSDTANTNPLTLTISGNTDAYISNTAYATAASTIPSPGSGGQSSNACTQPHEGIGYCSVSALTPYFGDPSLALMASLICQGESGSFPFNNNLVCPPDYSIGLFMINQLAHCSTAFSDPDACIISNQTLLDACTQRFYDPIENINYAVQLYRNRGSWSDWVTQSAAAESVISRCGNI